MKRRIFAYPYIVWMILFIVALGMKLAPSKTAETMSAEIPDGFNAD